MFWEFPLKVQTYNSEKKEFSSVVFETKKEFVSFCQNQFKLPGKYNIKNAKAFQIEGLKYSERAKRSGRPNFEGGYYTEAIKGTYLWKTYWANEKDKVLNGIIIDDIYIPPFYYWYLNFCPIYDDLKKKRRLGDVWDSDLWYFHYCMIAILTGKHIGGIKGRQKGYSYKHMAILYWAYSWFENSVNTIGAYTEDLVKKSWRFLEGYRKHINSTTAWKRGPTQPKSLEWNEATVGKDNIPYGLLSKLIGTTFKQSPFNDVGGSQTFFNYEEPGVSPTILQTLEAMRPAMQKGSETTGIMIATGSVGDLEDAEGIKSIFYSPQSYNFLPVKNIWDTKNPTDECCIFISEAYNMIGQDAETGRPFMDENGNSDVEFALQWIEKEQEKVRNTSKSHELKQIQLSQKCISPEQAFDQRKSSEFPAAALKKQQERILLAMSENTFVRKPIKCILDDGDDGRVKLITNNLPREHEYPIIPEWEDKRGVVTIYEMPEQNPAWLTYFAGVDTVEVDETTTSNSIMTVDIYKRVVKVEYKEGGKIKTRYEGGKIVATYRGRHNPVEKGNEQAWLLIKLFNAFSYVERSKPNFINYMKRNGRAEKYLAKESDVPMFKDMNLNSSLSRSTYGFIISPHNQVWNILKANVKEYFSQEFDRKEKPDGEVVKIYTGIDRIDDYWLLEEYIKYNDKGNFDRVISSAAAITIGKIYENEYGIKTISEVKEETPQVVAYQPKRINMLGGGISSSPSYGSRKPKSLL